MDIMKYCFFLKYYKRLLTLVIWGKQDRWVVVIRLGIRKCKNEVKVLSRKTLIIFKNISTIGQEMQGS